MSGIYKSYKDQLGFIVDIISLLTYIYGGLLILLKLISMLWQQPLLIQISGLFVFIILIIIILFKVKKIVEVLKFNKHVSEIFKVEVKNEKNIRNYDFERIIPKTDVIEHVVNECKSIAKKWSEDAFLSYSSLFISINNGKFNYDFKLNFHSPFKRLTMALNINNFSINKETIDNRGFKFDEEANIFKSFFEYKNWRDAVLSSIQRCEHSIMNRDFLCIIEQADRGRIHILPTYNKNETSNSFVFWFSEDKLIEGNRLNDEKNIIKKYI